MGYFERKVEKDEEIHSWFNLVCVLFDEKRDARRSSSKKLVKLCNKSH